MDLEKLFLSRPASTSLSLEQATLTGANDVELLFVTQPWWLPEEQVQGRQAELRLVLSGVRETQFENLHQQREVANFLFTSNDVLLWHYGQHSSIVGNAPLPDPPRFFTEYFALHVDHFQIPRPLWTYLYWPGTFREWTVSVYNRSYPLFTGPAEIATEVANLLDRQAAEYALLPDPQASASPNLFALRCDESWAVFESAALETRSRQ